MASSLTPSTSTLNSTEGAEENSEDEDDTNEMLDPRVKVHVPQFSMLTLSSHRDNSKNDTYSIRFST
jgi:hypothetical protein